MQRIRLGLTGLAFVFLFVLLGTAISRNSQAPSVAADSANAAEPSEPLAELGVAPGQGDSGNQGSANGNAAR